MEISRKALSQINRGHPALAKLALDAVAAFERRLESAYRVGRVAHSPAQLEERELRPTVKTGERCSAVRWGASKSPWAKTRLDPSYFFKGGVW